MPDTKEILEKAILDEPDDIAAHSAYADYLTEEGDPRGEFIQMQLALEDESRSADERKELQQRERELLDAHQREWLGNLAEYLVDQRGIDDWQREQQVVHQYQFVRGWLDRIRIPRIAVRLARTIARSPQIRLLRHLIIEGQTYEEEGEFEREDDIPADVDEYEAAAFPLIQSPYLGNVRVFHLGDPMEIYEGQEHSNCHTSGAAAADIVEKMARLEELYLLAHRVNMRRLFAMELANLRILQVYHNRAYPLDILASNPAMDNLTHLLLYPHGLEPDDNQAYITLDGVRAVVNSPHLDKLTHLRLRLSDHGDEGCEEIVRSGILKRLKMLDMMHGRITDRGAQMLADCPDLKNLELLDVSCNSITSAGIEALQQTGVGIQAGNQYDPGGDQTEFLWMGDME